MDNCFLNYCGKKYVCRNIYFPKFNNVYLVSCDSLAEVLLNENFQYNSSEARCIDEQIFFYLPDNMLYESSEKIVSYIEGETE